MKPLKSEEKLHLIVGVSMYLRNLTDFSKVQEKVYIKIIPCSSHRERTCAPVPDPVSWPPGANPSTGFPHIRCVGTRRAGPRYPHPPTPTGPLCLCKVL